MYIRKQRLLTPGPTPLLPSALHAMMGSDIHHRTEDFRKLYKQVLSGLQEVIGTSNDVIVLVSSGSGGLEAATQNFFSPGDEVLVCSAGKFGERWVEIMKAWGMKATVLTAPYGDVVKPEAVEAALAQNKNIKGVFVQASETSTGAAHDVKAMGLAVKKTDAIFVVDAITGLGTMPLDIDGWGLDVVIGGSQKAFMIPPGLAFVSISQKAWKLGETAKAPHFYFDLKKEKKNAATGESAWTPNTSLLLALAESLKYIKQLGMANLIDNARTARDGDAGRGHGTRPRTLLQFAGLLGHRGARAGRHGFRRDRQGIPQPLRRDYRQRPGLDEGADLPHRASGLLRFPRLVRRHRGTRNHSRRQRPSGQIRQGRGGRAEDLCGSGAAQRSAGVELVQKS